MGAFAITVVESCRSRRSFPLELSCLIHNSIHGAAILESGQLIKANIYILPVGQVTISSTLLRRPLPSSAITTAIDLTAFVLTIV